VVFFSNKEPVSYWYKVLHNSSGKSIGLYGTLWNQIRTSDVLTVMVHIAILKLLRSISIWMAIICFKQYLDYEIAPSMNRSK